MVTICDEINNKTSLRSPESDSFINLLPWRSNRKNTRIYIGEWMGVFIAKNRIGKN